MYVMCNESAQECEVVVVLRPKKPKVAGNRRNNSLAFLAPFCGTSTVPCLEPSAPSKHDMHPHLKLIQWLERGGWVCTSSSIKIAKIVKGGVTSTNQLFVKGGPPPGEMYVIQAKPISL